MSRFNVFSIPINNNPISIRRTDTTKINLDKMYRIKTA